MLVSNLYALFILFMSGFLVFVLFINIILFSYFYHKNFFKSPNFNYKKEKITLEELRKEMEKDDNFSVFISEDIAFIYKFDSWGVEIAYVLSFKDWLKAKFSKSFKKDLALLRDKHAQYKQNIKEEIDRLKKVKESDTLPLNYELPFGE
jgi:hypothetical protein